MTGSVTREQMMLQLRKIPEPCSIAMGNRMDICEMGLIEEVTFASGVARVVLCLTDPACVHFSSLRRYITDALLALDGVDNVEVTHTTTEVWTPERMRIRVLRT